ncbi:MULTISPECIES: hypothetical protein [Amycolatopsis]|uniref:Uncharacterized protein n=1 Tax=Amycolatopsis thermalba TaxID=944492 RepID=A0ABY4NXE3_9PSEU|nr:MULTISPECIES: hypothetical protein [Amycolatopsis]OXM72492.1 hypothetical protein CF166_15615 [Amycolatopsis sp. KNN50.9b]UQS24711.1 hypothetical protein L1857_18740 [Amycolatopsis thermalba]
MFTSMPFPVGFAVPPGWRPPEPAETGSPLGTVACVRSEPDAVIAAGGGFRPGDASLAEIAGESVRDLRESGATVDVLQHTAVGTAGAPGLAQVLLVRAPAAAEVVHCQAFLALHDTEDHGKRAVLRFVMATTSAAAPELAEDFRQFLGSIRPGSDQEDRETP